MTDTLTPRDPYGILKAALVRVIPGEVFTADNWHKEAAEAELTAAEKAAAHQAAIDDGYLVRVVLRLGGRTVATQIPSAVPSRRGGGVQLHTRTSKALPGQPTASTHHRERTEIDGQVDLMDLVEEPA